MPTAVENYIFNELPRRVVIDSSISTGSSFTTSWVLVATGVGTQAIPTDPTTLGFEPTVTPPGVVDPEIKFWNGNKDWVEISAATIGAIPTSEKGLALGVATLDADGFVELSQMNPAVIERVVVVADEAARYALTTAQVQNGDVVNQQSPLPGTMWYVVDDTNLDNSAGYLPFSAGVASSVAWSGITGKPAIIGDLEDIALAEEGDVIQYVAGEWVNVDPATLKTSLSISISDVTSLQEELDLKQSQSTVLDNLSAISTSGIVVRTVGGDFIGRELVGINGLEVAEADGNGDNPTISLTETGVTAGTYGNEYEHPVVEVDSYGRVVSVTEASSSNKEVVYILDQPTTQLRGNTRHIFGGGVVTYSSNILLELPENVPGGTWVKILCAQNFSEASGTIGISATNPTTVQGTSLFDYTAFFKLYPFTVIDLVYSSSTNNWTLTTNATSFLSSLYVARQGATDGVSNSHAIISNATSPRSLNIPDRDVDLSSVGQTDFLDSTFRVSDNTDSTKKIAFEASAVGTGQTRTITMPNANVDLGLVGQTDFLDTAFRISDNTDATKKIAFDAAYVGSGTTKTITMPNADIDLSQMPVIVNITSNTTYTVSGANGTRDHIILTTSDFTLNAQQLTTSGSVIVRSKDGNPYTVTKRGSQAWNFVGLSANPITVSAGNDFYLGGNTGYGYHTAYMTGSFAASSFAIRKDHTSNSPYFNFLAPNLTGTKTITMPNSDVDLGKVSQAASGTLDGYLASADWNTFNGKQAALVSGTNIKTVNGNSLLGNGNLSLFTPRVSTVTNIAYTLQVADNDGNTYLRVDTASSATITIPSTHTTPITIRRATSKSVTLQGDSGVTLNGSLTFDVNGSTKSLVPVGTNQFDIVG